MRCGACPASNPCVGAVCARLQLGKLPRRTWQGMAVHMPGWLRSPEPVSASVATSHPTLFAHPPAIIAGGTLSFLIHNASAAILPPCYVTCIELNIWLSTKNDHAQVTLHLHLHRDPCGAESSCRSIFFRSQLKCDVGRQWGTIFRRFDGRVTWGDQRGLAVLGGATVSQSPPPSASPPRSDNGGEVADELLMQSPAWSMPAGTSRLPKARGGSSFVASSDAANCRIAMGLEPSISPPAMLLKDQSSNRVREK